MRIENLSADDPLIRHIGYDLLGPVVHRWLFGLHQYVKYFDDGETSFLFSARAGVRIRRLYDIFLGGVPCEKPFSYGEVFWTSRIATCKGTFFVDKRTATTLIAQEYFGRSLPEVVAGVLRHHPERLRGLKFSEAERGLGSADFPHWIEGSTAASRQLANYFEECGEAFRGYVRRLTEGRKRAVVIDSGWQGTTQCMLTNAFLSIDWWGLYFGRILSPNADPSVSDKAVGILFQDDVYSADKPESAFILHRHLIESLLEPNAPSVEEVPHGSMLPFAAPMIAANREEKVCPRGDRLYVLVEKYLRENAATTISEIFKRHDDAMHELSRMLVTPTEMEARILAGKERSADFGKDMRVPVLLPRDDPMFSTSDERVKNSLWPQGQIALEYSGGVAAELQLRASGLVEPAMYFDPRGTRHLAGAEMSSVPVLSSGRPVVAVITRTKNRPLLLKRAAASMAGQSYENYTWVVVNDGGDEEVVREIIEDCSIDRRRIQLVSNSHSLGMEAASNEGIRSCESDYILIHDDDDSIAPDFISRCVDFLEGAAGRRYGGVITKTVYVSEEIRGDSVIEHARMPYQDWVRSVQLTEMACGNFFPPIAFLYRRSVWDEVGGYNESLPVLGDWYFNLEFLLRTDIAVIHEPLAFYHHRDRGDSSRSGIYANSVIGGVSKHEEFSSVVSNEFLRKNAGQNSAALAIVMGYLNREIRFQTQALKRQMESNDTSRSALSPAASGYGLDKVWVIAGVNRALCSKGALRLRMKGVHPLPPDASWDKILTVLQKANVAVQAPANFDEQEYLRLNPDVASACERGLFATAYEHFVRHGVTEGRARPTRG